MDFVMYIDGIPLLAIMLKAIVPQRHEVVGAGGSLFSLEMADRRIGALCDFNVAASVRVYYFT